MGLTAGERRGGLSELDIAQSDILQRPDLLIDRRVVLKELAGLIYTHIKDIGDVLAVISDFKSLPVISLTLSYVAGNIDIRKEMHLDLIYAVACAGFASSALCVKGESARLIASLLRIRCLRIKLSYKIEKSYVRSRITPRSPSDGALVDANDLIEIGISRDPLALYPGLSRAVELMVKVRHKCRIDKR